MRRFERHFGRPAEAVASAPGRVNLIGEHTDYNDGFVLPIPLPLVTQVAIAARPDREVHAVSFDLDEPPAIFHVGAETPRGGWADYAQAVTHRLAQEGFAVSGFDAAVRSQVPIGAGLSSSAALLVALLRALRARFGLDLDDLHLARVAQRAENDFVGARVGPMDPMVSSLGRAGHALFLDTRDLSWRRLPIPASIELVVIDSGVPHAHATGAYNQRRQECEEAARSLNVASLRVLGPQDLPRLEDLPEPLRRRARHVVTENARVLEAVAALEVEDVERLGTLLDEAHRSLRDDYEVSTPDVERLRDALRSAEGALGARLTGGGFGGSVLAVARAGRGAEIAARASRAYRRGGRIEPRVVLPLQGDEAPGERAREPLDEAEGRPRTGFEPTFLRSFFLGGFESSTHRLRNGRRLDMIAATRHDEFTAGDYRRMIDLGMLSARDGIRWHRVEAEPGRYEWSFERVRVRDAVATGIQVIWDLLHFGWPDHVDPFAPEFPRRFAEFARGFAEVLREERVPSPAVAPVNEISFLSFAGGQAGFFNPFAHGRGDELKRQLVSAALAGGRAVRAVVPEARLVHTDPVIHVAARRAEDRDAAEAHRRAAFHAWDAIAGRAWPELGGDPESLDVLGVNYYVHNQWYFPGGHGSMISPSSHEYRPLHELLLQVWERYRRPMFIAETGIEDEARPAWLDYVSHEAHIARREGADLQGICLYPIVNHPGWDDDRHCMNGLWDYADERGSRALYEPLARELERQSAFLERPARVEEAEERALRALRSLDEIAASIAEQTETSRGG